MQWTWCVETSGWGKRYGGLCVLIWKKMQWTQCLETSLWGKRYGLFLDGVRDVWTWCLDGVRGMVDLVSRDKLMG